MAPPAVAADSDVFRYPSGEPVRVGDVVEYRPSRRERLVSLFYGEGLGPATYRGVVDVIDHPIGPLPPWSNRKPGLTIRLADQTGVTCSEPGRLRLIEGLDRGLPATKDSI